LSGLTATGWVTDPVSGSGTVTEEKVGCKFLTALKHQIPVV